MDEFGKRVGQFPAPGQQLSEYAPSSGVGGAAAKKNSARQDMFQVAYPARVPDSLDFIVDNALPGGGLPFFNVEGDMLSYLVPPGYIAVVKDIEWYITPQNSAIDPAQLSMKLFVNQSLLQGTATMGIGQAGELHGLYIPVTAGALLTIRLGRGPAVARYTATGIKRLRANGDPNGFTAFSESTSGQANNVASLNGVTYVYEDVGGSVWRSFDGISFVSIATPAFGFVGVAYFTAFRNYLVISDGVRFYYSINGVVWTLATSALPGGGALGAFFEFNGQIWGWDTTALIFYQSSDTGQTWTAVPNLGLVVAPATPNIRCVVLNGLLYAVGTAALTGNMLVYTSADGQSWAVARNASTLDGVNVWDGRIGFGLAVFNAQIFLVNGFGAAAYAQVFTTSEGIAWTLIASGFANVGVAFTSVAASSALGIVFHASGPNNALYGVGLFPAIYDPELRCYCQIKGELLKAKGTVQQTILNPI